jgi:phage tail-like protein
LAAGLAQGAAQAALRAVTEQLLGLRFDPAPEYLFVVELTGIIVGLFTECSGIEVKREVKSWREGGVNNYEHQLPGPVSYSNITLKRGLSLSRALWDWFQSGLYDFNVRRINFSIIQGAPGYNIATLIAGAAGMAAAGGSTAESVASQIFGRGFGKVKHWNVIDAWPIEWKGSDLKTSSNSVAIETLKIAHHGLELSYEVGTPLNLGASIVGGIATAISAAAPEKPEPSCTPVEEANIAGPSTEVSVGERVTFSASVEPTNATEPITYHWDFGDGTTEEFFGTTISHTYNEADDYTVQLTAENMCGEASASFELTVVSTPLTDVTLSGPEELEAEQEGTFTAEVTPDDASPSIQYEWDFGDGTTLETTDADVEHSYTDEGTYTITVTATNPGGSASDTWDVTIKPCVPMTAIAISGPRQLEVSETGSFEAEPTPGDATEPIT